MRYLINIVSALLITCTVLAGTPDELFKRANSSYSKGDYKTAIAGYKQLLANGDESATVYYNLANAYYKSDSIAKAILYYEKAKKLNPADEDSAMNLLLANKKIQDKFESVPTFSLINFLTSITAIITVDSWAILAICLFLLALTALIFYFIVQRILWKKIFFRAMLITGFLSFIMFLGAQLQYYEQTKQQYGIIMAAAVDATSSPDEQGKRLYILHSGTKVKIITELEDWVEVRLPDNNVAWTKLTDIEKI